MQQHQHQYTPIASTSQSSLSTTTSTSSFAPSPRISMSTSSSSTSSAGHPNRSTTSTPVSLAPPRPTTLSRGASSAFDFLFGPSGGGPLPSTTQPIPGGDQKVVNESSGDASRIDKGKAVAREQDVERAEELDAIQRQQRVDKVLKRAEAAQLARAFRNRLALASFKTSRGWQDVNLDVIEPHLREEALKRQGSPADSPQNRDPSSSTSRQPQTAQGASGDQPYQYQINYEARPLDMEAVLSGGGGTPGGGGSAHKRTRSIDPTQGRGASPYGSSVGNNPLQPSPYSTASVYRSAKIQESPSDARSSKRRNTEGTTPRQRQKSTAAGSARKGTPLRQTTNGGTPAKPVSSADPTFSSFVDAATALTGMARAPSDPSLSGSEEDQLQHQQQSFGPSYSTTNGSHPLPMVNSIPHPPHHYHAFPQPQSHTLSQSLSQSHSFPTNSTQVNGHPTNNYLYTSLPLPSSSSATPARPATPDKTKTPGGGGGGGAGSAENNEVAAADLMLFLAHSPSPVQTRKTQPTLGDGSGIKGRRLFSTGGGGGGNGLDAGDSPPVSSSGAGGLAQSVFGDAFSPSQAPSLSRTTSSPFITSSGPSTSRALDTPFDPSASSLGGVEPSKPSSYLSSGLGSAAPIGGLDASSASDAFGTAPGTPRQRQSSFNGQGWESFINASPSPTRATVPRGDTPPRLGGAVGGEGEATAA